MIETQLNAVAHSSNQMSSLFSGMFTNNLSAEAIQNILQNSIQDANISYTYVTVFNWSGKIIAHPNRVKIGTIADYYDANTLESEQELSSESLYNKLKKDADDIVMDIKSIDNSDWIIASHVNLANLNVLKHKLLLNNIIIFSILSLFLILTGLILLRHLHINFEKTLAEKQNVFTDKVSTIDTLNEKLEQQRESIIKELDKVKQEVNSSNNSSTEQVIITNEVPKQEINTVPSHDYKSRVLTYHRNELVSINVKDIAIIFVENTITYFLQHNGKRSTSNDSLDQIYSELDPRLFFKANRQYIVSIAAIEKISKYGNSQLKLTTNPATESEIIVGKNKASAFKKWLHL